MSILCGDVAACREMAYVLFAAHMPFHNVLPHLHTINNDIILLNVLTEI